MDTNQVKQLLAKYSEGNTTLFEEKALLEYFTEEHEIDADLKSWKAQFTILKNCRELKFDISGLESKIAEQIDGSVKIPPSSRKLHVSRFLVAASIALMITIGGVIFFQIQRNQTKDTFTDPQIAYHETQKALLYISLKMNKGIEPLSNISKISTGSDKLKTLEKMDESLGMLNLVSFINKSSNLKK